MRSSVGTLLTTGLVLLGVVGWAAGVRGQVASASSAPLGSPADIQALRERAAAYWAARLAGDLRGQWELLEPRGSGRLTAEEYGAGRAVRYLGYQIDDATVRGFFATVSVRVLFHPVLPSAALGKTAPTATPMASVIADTWVRIDGLWYHTLEDGESGPSQASRP
jgi:hypothetical protein